MRMVWRFYVGPDHRWRWQKMSPDCAVVAESPTSFNDYDECVAAARAGGYVFEVAQQSSRRSSGIRSYQYR